MIGNDKIRLSYRQLIMRNNLISFFTQRLLFHGQQFCLTPRITPRTQGQVHPQRRQRLSTLPLVSAGQPISIFFFLPFFLFCFCDFNGYIFSPTSRPVDSKYPCPRPVSGTDAGLKTRMYRAPRQVPGAFLRLTLPGGNSKMKRTGGGPPEKGNVFLDRGGVSYGTCKSIFFRSARG